MSTVQHNERTAADLRKNRRQGNLKIGLVLFALVVAVFAYTIMHLGPSVIERAF